MLLKINVDNFESEVKKSNKPVLLASFYRGYDYKSQIVILEALKKTMNGQLKIGFFNEDYKKAFNHLKIEGVPTFILLRKGKEVGRLLGKADNKKLIAFVKKYFPNLKFDE